MTRVAVVGSTGWGTTLAVLFARNGADVTLLTRTADEASLLNGARENQRRCPGLKLPDNLTCTAEASELAGAEVVLIAVPSATLRANLELIAPRIAGGATVLSATKGIEPETGRRVSEIITAAGIEPSRLLALSGPNFAREIAKGQPAATVVAGPDRDRATAVQQLLTGSQFRVYTSDDIAGVEIGGALKNVVAIACGLSDGLGFGENAKAGLITRGLAEITRLGVAAGAHPLTFQGLAGIGDLVLSCTSNLSRNRRMGLALAKGRPLVDALEKTEGVVEGVVTAKAIPAIASKLGVEMPICHSLYQVLYESRPVLDAARGLMARAARPELDNAAFV